METATVTKLTRNLFIIAIIPLVSYLFFNQKRKESGQDNIEKDKVPKWYTFILLFVIGFLILSVIRTIGDATLESSGVSFGIFTENTWKSIYTSLSSFGTTYLLGIAMAGVGLSTNFKGMGLKPFYIGFIAALAVGTISLIFVSLFGGLVKV
ncbi:putative sulfate exporter family transporter [Oceanobacillus jeddahense]|uniref:Sulfate exporter family transporter n=1 Tax=Oceanobacillus jeddahense TaxID=1462527 RepID=A0ABY5JZR5_9BACI|nr:putative sulfate exporter family transporter [Oceanobacillus jeddahense]UUI05521.1 putative sulfate exporter family transporter [Oceanobacillus jeddahense]